MRYLLKGTIRPGMFPSERVVLIPDYQGRIRSVMVQEYAIHELDGNQGSVEVREIDSRDNMFLVTLPGESLADGQTITVNQEQLRPVTSHNR